MKIIYFLQNHSINLSEIWSDCSIYVCIWLVSVVLLAIWSSKNYKRSVESEYKEVTKTMVNSLNHEIDRLESQNSYLKQAFDSYKYDTQRELIELKSKLPKRNPDGTFAVKTGKGHGNKKVTEIDWTKATKEELLAEAKRRYPIGTKFAIAHFPDTIRTVKTHDEYKNTFNFDETHINFLTVEDDNECLGASVYANGFWAKIIKS